MLQVTNVCRARMVPATSRPRALATGALWPRTLTPGSTASRSDGGQLARDLLPPSLSANPHDQRSELPSLGLAAVLAAKGEERRVHHDVAVGTDLLLLRRVGDGVDRGPSGAEVGESVGARQALAACVDEGVLRGEESPDGRDVGAAQRIVVTTNRLADLGDC